MYAIVDTNRSPIPAGKHHAHNAKFNWKGTLRWVPVSNATLDKDTLTKALGTAQMTIFKSMVTFFGMAISPREGLKMNVTCAFQRKHPKHQILNKNKLLENVKK